MNGGRCSTTRIWRPPSSTASWSADGSFASMDPRDELVISSSRTPCQAVPNGSEYLEYVAQNFRNPHCSPQRRMQAHPPGPGLPIQLPSVTTVTSCIAHSPPLSWIVAGMTLALVLISVFSSLMDTSLSPSTFGTQSCRLPQRQQAVLKRGPV